MTYWKKAINKKSLARLKQLKNRHVLALVKKYTNLCRPKKVTVLIGSPLDIDYVRKLSLTNKEELPLSIPGHTIHFDGYFDQGRDLEKTKVLLKKGEALSKYINTGERDSCLKEIFALLANSMKDKEMLVLFYCLGPTNSQFSIPALQITDSAYVAHSENILYRPGYEEFKRLDGSNQFFYFIHSAGELENGVSKNYQKKRIYIDLHGNRIFSVNTQYAGNSVGLKKLSLRLAIKKGDREGWLCEHMLIMDVRTKKKKGAIYLTGAFPSACGKTSTAMIPGGTIIGDDIAYIKRGRDGRPYTVNVEQGIFGIIENVNPIDDPLIYKALTTPSEVIFSNVLIHNGKPYWLGMGKKLPAKGVNYAGVWYEGKKDDSGQLILPAHKNARYTIKISELENADPSLNNPKGVPIAGIIYGGRDSDTSPPVIQAFNWIHGVFIGASLESETTAATLGKMGVRKYNPLANLDFLTIPLGKYLKNHLEFGKKLKHTPQIFQTNYFLKENGQFLNQKVDKKIWLLWMAGRIHGEFEALTTPIGFLPKYEDLVFLFKNIFQRRYKKEDYEKQFALRTNNLLAKFERIETIFKEEIDIPKLMFLEIDKQRKRLLAARKKFGQEIISPFCFR